VNMILSESYVQWLLDEAISRVSLPADCGMVIEGSIAEGFGNDTSDIDFLFICDDDYDYPTMPSILFVDGRRVEVRTRSLSQVREQASGLLDLAAAGPRGVSRISVDLLNRCQRLSRSFPLRNDALVDRAQNVLPASHLPAIVSPWFAHYARQAMRYAVALNAMHQFEEGANWARVALARAAKAWLAAQGETYVEPKWLPQQFLRSGADASDLVERFWSLTRTRDVAVTSDDSYLAATARLVHEFGVDRCPPDPTMVTVAPERHVTTWQVGDKVHIIRGRQDVFALGSQAATVWRSVVLATPLPDLLTRTGQDPATSGEILAEFHRVGLLRLRWRNGGTITSAQPYAPALPSTPPPSTSMPILGLDGAVMPDENTQLALMPLPAKRFGAAAMAHVWSNVMIENAREDLTGALAQQQWGVAEISAHRMLLHACRVLLSAYGVSPLPPDSAIVERLRQLPQVPDNLATLAETISRNLNLIDSPRQGGAIADSLEAFVGRLRKVTGADLFPASFESSEEWNQTIQIGHDWVRIGAFLDSDFPIEEARDLFHTGGAQPHVVASPQESSRDHRSGG
jgi:hypothetical protein